MGDKEEHISRHKELHKYLDELVADYIMCTEKTLGESAIFDLIKWSHQQTLDPVIPKEGLKNEK